MVTVDTTIERMAQAFLKTTRDIACEEYQLAPLWAILATRDMGTREALETPTLILLPTVMLGPAQRDHAASVVAEYARLVEARAILFASEAWVVTAPLNPDGSLPALSVAPEDHPDRQECVTVLLETPTHHTMWRAEITNLPGHTPDTPRRSMGEWIGGQPDDAEGRFTNLLRGIRTTTTGSGLN